MLVYSLVMQITDTQLTFGKLSDACSCISLLGSLDPNQTMHTAYYSDNFAPSYGNSAGTNSF